MRTKNVLFKAILLLVIVIFGCKKQEEIIVLDNYVLIDTLSKNYDFDIEVNREIFDEYYSNDTTQNTYYLDINNDGIKDLKIKESSSASSGGLSQSSRTIETLNSNISFAITEKVDTFCTYTIDYGSYKIFYSANYESDHVYNSSLSLKIESNFYPCILFDNDTIDEGLNWTQGSYYLSYANSSNAGAPGSNRYVSSIYKGIWRNIDRKYIGLKFSDQDDTYMGWLRLGVGSEIMVYRASLKKVKNST
jgi:hypothetical protein